MSETAYFDPDEEHQRLTKKKKAITRKQLEKQKAESFESNLHLCQRCYFKAHDWLINGTRWSSYLLIPYNLLLFVSAFSAQRHGYQHSTYAWLSMCIVGFVVSVVSLSVIIANHIWPVYGTQLPTYDENENGDVNDPDTAGDTSSLRNRKRDNKKYDITVTLSVGEDDPLMRQIKQRPVGAGHTQKHNIPRYWDWLFFKVEFKHFISICTGFYIVLLMESLWLCHAIETSILLDAMTYSEIITQIQLVITRHFDTLFQLIYVMSVPTLATIIQIVSK